jgi:gas vesicle protein
MDILSLLVGLVLGFILGSGTLLFYMKWKMTRQLNAMQQNMEGMFDMTEDMMQDFEMDEESLSQEEEKE